MPRPVSDTPAGHGASWEMVETPKELKSLCRRLAGAPCIGLDTEFERSRTFHARLALLQLDDGELGFVLDPLAVGSLSPLSELLEGFQPPVIMHAPSEDLTILERALGLLPHNLFDTQLAAALCGRGWGIGYDRLVEQLFNAVVSKSATRSDWLRRPLSAAQREYAAVDVRYLPQAHALLRGELDALGRSLWLEEETVNLIRRMREPEALRDVARLARKVGKDERALGRMNALCHWRETEARNRDMPRRQVMDDTLLVHCARSAPAGVKAMGALAAELHPRGKLPMSVLYQGVQAAADASPIEPPPEAEDLREHRAQLSKMKAVVSSIAEHLKLPGELLAPRRLLEQLLVVTVMRRQPPPAELLGWRADVVLEPLLQVLRRD